MKELKLKDKFSTDIINIGLIDIDHGIVPITLYGTSLHERICLDKDDLIQLAEHLDNIINKMQ